MKRAAGVTLAIAAVIAAMFFGEAGNPFAIAPLAFGVALSIAIAFLLDSRRLVQAGIGLAAIAIYVGVFALGLMSFGRAFNECVDVGESVRRQVEAFRAIHGAYPEDLSRIEGPMPCALVTRPSVPWRLHRCGFRIYITEIAQPMAVRRKVSFCEAVYDGESSFEGGKARLIRDPKEMAGTWDQGQIPVLVDPQGQSKSVTAPDVIVDAILAKKNLGTSIKDAHLVIALGPGFEAGKDAHYVVETNRGHNLGRLLSAGSAEPNTGVPGSVKGISADRVLRSPSEGLWKSALEIGDLVAG